MKCAVYAMCQRARGCILTNCYRKTQIDVGFQCRCPVIDNAFRQNIVKIVRSSTATLTML